MKRFTRIALLLLLLAPSLALAARNKPIFRACLDFPAEAISDSRRGIFAPVDGGIGGPTSSETGGKSADGSAERARAENSKQTLSDDAGIPVATPLTTRMQSPEVLDSLLSVRRGEATVSAFEKFFDDFVRLDTVHTFTSETPDSVYQSRLKGILSPVGMPWNSVVKQYIVKYTTQRMVGVMGRILSRSQYYFPIVEEELAAAGLPLELRMLPIIESALVPTARSRAGATGLWQFMYGTGKAYGLEITTYVDQRCDPVAATRAACRYLADLYRMYGDWQMVLAAFNCGPGNVNKALKRAGEGARTYWDIYPYLPAETRGYVPSFIAATYAYTYHRQHGIEIAEGTMPLAVDTVKVNRLVHLGQIATTLDVPIETLRALNPQYTKDIVPSLDKEYSIVLPQNLTTSFIGMAGEIHGKDTLYLAGYLNPANISATRAALTATATPSKVHRVKKGETLALIARKYHVTTKQLMTWNRLKSANKLAVGQRLEIRK